MNKAIALTVFMMLSTSLSLAGTAGDLAGKKLECSYTTKLYGGTERTIYHFTNEDTAIEGERVVSVFEPETMNRFFAGYSLSGNQLVIRAEQRQDKKFDISSPGQIRRNFTLCVRPAYGGGDVEQVCEDITEFCTLR